jgi:hyperosmotically inducible periplasmic protein
MRFILVFLLGALAGWFGQRWYQQRDAGRAVPVAGLATWHLTPDEVRADLARTGEIVRTKAEAIGRQLSDARIVALIKAKYVLDRNLSSSSIAVESHGGAVVLRGEVPTSALAGRAVMLALDTDGVRSVAAHLKVPPGS